MVDLPAPFSPTCRSSSSSIGEHETHEGTSEQGAVMREFQLSWRRGQDETQWLQLPGSCVPISEELCRQQG